MIVKFIKFKKKKMHVCEAVVDFVLTSIDLCN